MTGSLDGAAAGNDKAAAGSGEDEAAAEGAGKRLTIEALTFTRSRMASEENSANRTATAAAAQTTARIREERDALRPVRKGVM